MDTVRTGTDGTDLPYTIQAAISVFVLILSLFSFLFYYTRLERETCSSFFSPPFLFFLLLFSLFSFSFSLLFSLPFSVESLESGPTGRELPAVHTTVDSVLPAVPALQSSRVRQLLLRRPPIFDVC